MLERQLTSRSIMNSMNLSQYWTFSMETEPRATWTIKHTLKQWWHASFHSHRQTGTAFWGGRWIWVRREKQWRDRVTVLWWSHKQDALASCVSHHLRPEQVDDGRRARRTVLAERWEAPAGEHQLLWSWVTSQDGENTERFSKQK